MLLGQLVAQQMLVLALALGTQCPLPQAVSAVQFAPSSNRLPQVVLLELQSVWLRQEAVVVLQFPAPSQVLVVKLEPVHEGEPQAIPLAVTRHWPTPSQLPSRPQGGIAVQALCVSVPAVTG
jgi:hypothetical protein